MKQAMYYITETLRAELDRRGLRGYMFCRQNHLSSNHVYAALNGFPVNPDQLTKISAALGVDPETLITDTINDIHEMDDALSDDSKPPCGVAFVLRLLGEDYPTSSTLATTKVYPMAHRMSDGKYIQS